MEYSLSKSELQAFLSDPAISRLDKLLLLVFWNKESSKSISDIKKLGSENGLKECAKWNIPDVLGKSKGKATALKDGWTLTTPGRTHLLEKKYITQKKSFVLNDVSDLKTHSLKIKNSQTKSFVEEAISCLEADLLRAAVVLSWVGAVAILYDEIIAHHLIAFNTEALRRDAKWKSAKNADDLAKMKEADFLNVIESISLIGKNVKQELEQSLKLRNGCGHPNSLKFGFRRVAAHIEVLIMNIYSKF